MKAAFAKFLDLLLPPRCIVSGEPVAVQGAVAPEIWGRLNFIGDPLCRICGTPFHFRVDAASLCGGCLRDTPPYDSARAALVYDDHSRDMILRFKHADQIHAVHSFVPWMRRAGADALAKADLLVPVPLHRWRLFRRRYNQAAVLSAALSRACGTLCVPDVLLRQRMTKSQGHMRFRQRRANVRGAFSVNPRYLDLVKQAKVVLVDDVYTTGSTVRECVKILKKAGATEVHVLTLAKVVRPD